MIRKFLFEFVDDLKSSKKETKDLFFEYLDKYKDFRDLIDITYNPNYNWEFDNKYTKKSRSNRPYGGTAGQWCEAVRLIKRTLIRNNNQTVNFTRRLDRLLESCNQKDIDIILTVLKERKLKYINSKVVKWLNDGQNI